MNPDLHVHTATLPVELEHAERHLAGARLEWEAGHRDMARMHLREALCDTAWSLYCFAAEEAVSEPAPP